MASRKLFYFLFVVFYLFFVVGCSKNTSGDLFSDLPRKEVLNLTGFQWEAPSNFNPLNGYPSFPVNANVNLIYEALFGYNLLTGELEGILAKEYMLDGEFLTVLLNENAMWHNGEVLTAEDVVFTFNLHKRYETNLHTHWLYISEIKADGDYAITFRLNRDKFNPLVMKDIISQTYILPKTVFSKIEKNAIESVKAENSGSVDLAKVIEKMGDIKNDSTPMGSGPYTLRVYNDSTIILNRVDNYWGNIKHGGSKPAPNYIVHTMYASNDDGNIALEQGKIDLSQNFITKIWDKFEKGVGTWFDESPYYIPGTIPSLLMNMTKEPFSDICFRRAVGHAINFDEIKELSIFGYAPSLRPGFIIPEGPEAHYISEDDIAEYGNVYDPQKACLILKNAGYSWGDDSLLVAPDGNVVPLLTITCPTGWTDWETTITIVANGLRKIGLNVDEKFLSWSDWNLAKINAQFDFTIATQHSEQSASLPWVRFNRTMSSENWADAGSPMYQNEGRYKNPVADSLLKIIPKLTDDDEILETYKMINVLFMKELPVIPLMYRPWFFYEFSTKKWTNFPTSDNPHSPPQCLVVGAGIKGLWELKSVGK